MPERIYLKSSFLTVVGILLLVGKLLGRVSVLDLPRALNANSSDIQDRIQALIRSRPGRIFQIQDELVKL